MSTSALRLALAELCLSTLLLFGCGDADPGVVTVGSTTAALSSATPAGSTALASTAAAAPPASTTSAAPAPQAPAETHDDCRPHVPVNQCERWQGVELLAADGTGSAEHVGAERCLCKPMAWRIPPDIKASAPPAKGIAELSFDYQGKNAKCVYHAKNGGTALFTLQTCSHGLRSGDLLRSRYFDFEMHGGPNQLRALLKLGQRRFVTNDPLLGHAQLRVPMDAAPSDQEFTLTREEMVPPGIYIAEGNDGVTSAGAALEVSAIGSAGHYDFAPGTCAELDLPIDPQNSGLSELPPEVLTAARAVRFSFSDRTPDAVATLTPVEGNVQIDRNDAVATVCVTHLSQFGLVYDDTRQVLVTGTLTFDDKSGSQIAPIRNGSVEIWRYRPRFLGIWSWGASGDAFGTTDDLGHYGIVLDYVGSNFDYGMRIVAKNYAAAAVNNFDVQMWTEPEYDGEVEHRRVTAPGELDWDFEVGAGHAYPTYADPRLLFNVIDTARVAREYAERHRHPAESDVIPQLNITVTPLTASTYYDCAVSKKIWMQPSVADDDISILHEYSHFLEEKLSGIFCTPTNHDGCEARVIGLVNSPEHAWLEGFADYLAQAIFFEQNLIEPGRLYLCPTCPVGTSSISLLEQRESCSGYNLFGNPIPYVDSGHAPFGPDAVENYVASSLWAMNDAPSIVPAWNKLAFQGDAIFKIFDHELDPDNGAPTPTIREFKRAWLASDPHHSYADITDTFRHFLIGDGDDAATPFISFPLKIVSGRHGVGRVDLVNIGTTTWNSYFGYRLAPGSNDTLPWDRPTFPLTVPLPSGTPVDAKVDPGQHISVNVEFTAPCVTSDTPFSVQARMQNPAGSAFGDESVTITTTVQKPNDCDKNGVCDNACGIAETCATCPQDCGQCCGNQRCEPEYGENFVTCGNDCPDPCSFHNGCDDCMQDAACGWCSDGSQCRSGSDAGPVVGSCGSEWRSAGNICPDTEILSSETWGHFGPNYSAELLFPGSAAREINVTDRPLPLEPPIPSACPNGARRILCVVSHLSGGGHCEFAGWASDDPHDCGCVVHVGANVAEWDQKCQVSVIGRQ